MDAKDFLNKKGIKDILFCEGVWVKEGLSKLLDEYNPPFVRGTLKNKKTGIQTADQIIDNYCMVYGNQVSRTSLKKMIEIATAQAIHYGYKAGFYGGSSSPRLIEQTVNEYLNEIDK